MQLFVGGGFEKFIAVGGKAERPLVGELQVDHSTHNLFAGTKTMLAVLNTAPRFRVSKPR